MGSDKLQPAFEQTDRILTSNTQRTMKKIFFVAVLALLTAVPSVVFAQQSRVAMKGDAYLLSDGKHVALEVAGKVVIGFDTEFTEIITSTGNYFAARYKEDDSDWYIYDRNGEEVELGGGSYGWSFDKVSMVAGTIIVEEKGKTYYFSENDLSTAIKPQAAGHDFFEKEIEKKGGFSPKLAGQRADVEAMEKALSEVDPIGWFELRTNDKGSLDLVVDGKVLFTSNSFRLLSDAAEYNKSGCWFFRISRGNNYPRYGVYCIAMFMEDGKKVVQNEMMIPYEYTFIAHDGGNVVRCTKQGGAIEYFNWWGWHFDVDRQTRKFVSTNEKWVYNKATDKWSLIKQESKK